MAGFSLVEVVVILLIAVRPCLPLDHNRIVNCYEEICNKHSDRCSQARRICMRCKDNTHGPHCNLCLSGFYGNATESKDGCKRCPCPFTKSSGVCKHDTETNAFECIECKQGYHGKLCTECDIGYYKNITDGLCRPCFCSNHGNSSLVQQCDPVGGSCYYCSSNRVGKHCEACKAGYYMNSMNGTENCVECRCNGNTDPERRPVCDLRDGVCLQCTFNTSGINCEKCANGYEGDAIVAKNCTKIQHPDFGTRHSTSRYAIVALVTVLSIIILALLAVTGLVWMMRRKARDPLGFVTINMNHADEEDYNIAWIDPVTGDPIRHNDVDTEMPMANGSLEPRVNDDYDNDDDDYDLGDNHEPESRDTDRML